MKKIYIFAAVLALLSLSLYAQVMTTKQVATQQATSTEKVKQPSIDLNFYKQALTNTLKGPNAAPMRAGSYTLLSDAIDGSKFSTGSNISPSAPWTATSVRNQSGGVLYIMSGGSLVFTVPSGYNNADFKFEFKTSTSYYNGYFTFTPSTGSAQQVTTSAASTVYECELTGLSAGNTVTITGKYGSSSYSPDFMYMYVYVAQSTPTITASPSSVNLTSAPNESATETVTVTGANLTGGITATISGTNAALFSVSPTNLGTSGGTLTVTYSPTALGNHTATLTLSSTGAQNVTISLNGTCTNEKFLTVCDGQYYAETLPVYGYFYDEAEHNQMVYTSTLLGTEMAGNSITSMTFYPTTGWHDEDNDDVQDSGEIYSGINFYGGSVTFKLMNLSSGTSAFAQQNPTLITGTMTPVATVTPARNTSATTWVITFDQPFEYTGGDLLIDVTTIAGTYSPSFFTVDAVDDYRGAFNVSYNGTNYNYGTNYLPKVTFTYEEQDQHDLAIALDAQPATVAAGGNVTLTATVTNNGDYAETGYTVTFYANGTLIDTQNGGSLAIGGTQTFTATYTTTDAQGGTNVNFSANVACADDAVAANDNATASTSVITLPPPENVAATPNGANATVTWDVPNIPSVLQTLAWDFEEESDFNAFTLIDADGDGYNWAWHYNTGTNNLDAHSGNGIAYSQSYDKATSTVLYPNNWLISPEITLGGSLSLWACGQDPNQYWNEVFGVYVCVGSYNGVSSFVQVDADVTTTHDMTQYTYDLSQYSGQGYFAIVHHNVHDEFYLNVDDINYEFYVPGEQPTSYNVYLDGQLVGSVNANDPLTYDFSNLADGNYTVEISAVYSLGESALVPATFTISSTNPELAISPETQTINDASAGTLAVTGTDIEGNISVSAGTNWTLDPTSLDNTGGNVNVTYTGRDLSATTTVTASATGATDATATVNYVADLYIVGDFGSGWDFNNGTHMTYANGTYTATLTANANSYILFARLLGNNNPWNTRDVFGPSSDGNWWMQGNSNGGNLNLNDDNCIYFPEGGTYRITINANDGTFTITKLNGEQTATPTIDYTVGDEYVTITATGDGTVTLNVPGYDPVSGEGEASITIPRGYASNTITVTATAQEDGKDESDPASREITIPAGSDWVEMDGTYDDPNTLLSFLKDGEDIMMLDQFKEYTIENGHPDGYIYTLREDRGGEQKMSTPVPIPVYKTFSTMQGVYTKNQVDNDKNMKLKANVLNAEMDFNVAPDGNVLYYNLYRSNLNGDYPVIDDTHRVSKLQQFDEQVGDYSQFFLFESHTSGVIPRYDHFGNGIVERLDTNYVQGEEGNELSYVPVIWTLGINSARGDGKDNSYGSDIKRETLGNVTAEISGTYTKNNTYGTWDVNDVEYCVFHPTIEVTGVLPQAPLYRVDYNDGDYAEYEPYMCRAWCTYEGIHDFIRNSEGNLEDAGALTTPYWLGDATFDNSLSATIGGEWTGGAIRDQWSFGLPSTTNPNEVTYIIRFYYKKVVTDAQNQQNGGSGAKVGGEDEVYFMTQTGGEYGEWVVGINELYTTIVPVDVTYVNPQGMQSNRPFDGLNIVVTRYSDGSTRTTKIIR